MTQPYCAMLMKVDNSAVILGRRNAFARCLITKFRLGLGFFLIISNGKFENHLNKVKFVLKKPKATGFKINAEKLFFARDNLEYLARIINF